MTRKPFTVPDGFTLEQITELAELRLRDQRNKYNKEHPEIIERQRIRTNTNFLKKHGFCVLDIKNLPKDIWGWDELTQRSLVNAIRAAVQEYREGMQ